MIICLQVFVFYAADFFLSRHIVLHANWSDKTLTCYIPKGSPFLCLLHSLRALYQLVCRASCCELIDLHLCLIFFIGVRDMQHGGQI